MNLHKPDAPKADLAQMGDLVYVKPIAVSSLPGPVLRYSHLESSSGVWSYLLGGWHPDRKVGIL